MSEGVTTSGLSELRDWMRGTWALTLRVTVLSLLSTAAVGALLVLVHQLAQRDGKARTELLGVKIDLGPLASAGYDLPLLLLALALWVLLGSLTRLFVAHEVRNHLQSMGGSGADDAASVEESAMVDDEEAAEGGNAMAERLLLESYLNLVGAASRAVAMTILLVLLVPRIDIIGLAIVLALDYVVARGRFATGLRANSELQQAAENDRRLHSPESRRQYIDSIYRRDRLVMRLTIGQASLVVAAVVFLVIAPIWVLQPSRSSVPALLVALLWLQALLSATTDSGVLAWRYAHWYRLRHRPRATTGRGRQRGALTSAVALMFSVPDNWPKAEVTWLRAGDAAPTLVAFRSADGRVAGLRCEKLARVLFEEGISLLTLAHRTSPDDGYAALGPDLPDSLAKVADLVGSDALVVVADGCDEDAAIALSRLPVRSFCVLNGPGPSAPGILRETGDRRLQSLHQEGALSESVLTWLRYAATGGSTLAESAPSAAHPRPTAG